ncbi:hypothetical protein BH10BAC3_BH10BAC3_23450 [soil metagenome]
MQDQKQNQNQDQNGKSGLQQDSANADTQQWQRSSGDDSGNDSNSDGTEINYPQQPRREEEPIVSGQQNRSVQTNRAQEGGMGNQQGKMSDDESNRQSSQRPMNNSGTRMNKGSRTEQISDDEGNQSSRQTGSDDYRRNDIANKEQQ